MRQVNPVKRVRQKAYKVIAAQWTISMIVALVFLVTMGGHAGVSALLGGIAYALPSAYFARKLFSDASARQAKAIVKRFYWGEMIKLLLSAILAVLFVRLYHVNLIAFFITFFCAQIGFWIAPLVE